jgi:hypothetical protein
MSGVTFERLPPERRIAAPSAASAGGCCCCCCCCLHTVGSLIGALTAKAPAPSEVPTAVAGSDRADPSFKVTKEYWATVLVLCTVGLPLFAFSQGVDSDDFSDPEMWLLLWAMVLPVIQLVASLVVVVRNQFSKRPGQRERMQHLGSITGRAFLGGMLGVLAMVIIGTAFLR